VLDPLADRGDLLYGEPVRLLGIGITYGNQAAVIDETYADVTPLPIAVLADRGGWEATALEATWAAEAAANALAGLAANLARSAGCDDDRLLTSRRLAARTRLYAELDGRFRDWIAGLGGSRDEPAAALARWRREVRAQVTPISAEMLGAVPPQAVRGRELREGELINAARAEIWFRAAIRKPSACPPGRSARQLSGSPLPARRYRHDDHYRSAR
jgi:CRISPR system Cascade subunit CasA